MADGPTGCQGWWSECPGQARVSVTSVSVAEGPGGGGNVDENVPLCLPLLLGFLAADPDT